MNLKIREMDKTEAKQLQRLGLKTFLRSLEAFWLPRPDKAMVAVLDGKIVGGFMYSFETFNGKKLGHVDFFFIEPAYAGQGIGGKLCSEGVDFLWKEGCDYLAAVVRDDNAGSWAAFEKNGFVAASLPKVAKELKMTGFIKTYVKHMFGFSPGCDFYFAVRPEVSAEYFSKKLKPSQTAVHLFMNFALLLLPAVAALSVVLPIFIIFVGMIFFGFAGTLFSRRRWHYRMTDGGFLISVIVFLSGGFFPMFGGWYPDKYENTAKFRRDMAVNALFLWVFLIGIFIAFPLFGLSNGLVYFLLILKCFPIPHVNFGSTRVFRWNKIVYGLMILITLFLVACIA